MKKVWFLRHVIYNDTILIKPVQVRAIFNFLGPKSFMQQELFIEMDEW